MGSTGESSGSSGNVYPVLPKGETTPRPNINYQPAGGSGYQGGAIGSGYPGQGGNKAYPGQSGGYPQQPGGYPQQPGGYPQQPGGYPQQPGGYPQQGTGYRQPSGYYPGYQGGYQQGKSFDKKLKMFNDKLLHRLPSIVQFNLFFNTVLPII